MIRLLRLLRPYRLWVSMVLSLIFLQSMASLYLPNLMSKIVDEGVLKGRIGYIIHVGEWMLLVAILGSVCSVSAGWFSAKTAAAFSRDLRRDVFRHVESFLPHEFDHIGTSSLIVRTTNDIMQVQQFVNMMLRMMVMAPLMAIGGIILAVYTDAPLSIIIVVVMPVLGIAVYSILRKEIGLFRLLQKKVDTLNRVVREHLSGVRVIRSFHRTGDELQRFDGANGDLTDVSVNIYKIMAILMPIMLLVMNFSTIAIVWFGGLRINAGQMQVGSLMAFIQYTTQILMSVMMASAMFFMIPRAQASALRINEVLDTTPAVADPLASAGADPPVASLPAATDTATATVLASRGVIEFEHVTFRHAGAETPALQDISFRAAPGEVTAIIGGTGAGKSTLLHLILRFFDPEDGRVLVDGTDVRNQPQAQLRRGIGYVPQKALLFSGSITDNVRYGRDSATPAEVADALRVAQATEFVQSLPEGVDARIVSGGGNLSGGQKQRLAMARALVRRPGIYLFDDSFSALDFATDARLRAALRPEIAQATVLIVAQRISTVMDADHILVLEDGRLIGQGRHAELMEHCPAYREIADSQLAGEVSAS